MQGGHQDYELMSGTSMAAPQIAGIGALVKQYIESKGLFLQRSDRPRAGPVDHDVHGRAGRQQ